MEHNDNEIIQLNKNHKYYLQLYQQMFVTEYHWGVLVAQGTNGDLKKWILQNISGLLYLKNLNLFLIHALFMNLLIQEFNLD